MKRVFSSLMLFFLEHVSLSFSICCFLLFLFGSFCFIFLCYVLRVLLLCLAILFVPVVFDVFFLRKPAFVEGAS